MARRLYFDLSKRLGFQRRPIGPEALRPDDELLQCFRAHPCGAAVFLNGVSYHGDAPTYESAEKCFVPNTSIACDGIKSFACLP